MPGNAARDAPTELQATVRTTPGIARQDLLQRIPDRSEARDALRTLLDDRKVMVETVAGVAHYFPTEGPLRREERIILALLNEPISRKVIAHLLTKPGTWPERLRRETGLSRATVRSRLRRLEQAGMLQAAQIGACNRISLAYHARFSAFVLRLGPDERADFEAAKETARAPDPDWPMMPPQRQSTMKRREVNLTLLDAVRASPGASQAQLARILGVAPKKASYHLGALEEQGFISRVSDGRFVRFYPGAPDFPEEQCQAFAWLHRPQPNRIIRHLIVHPGASVRELRNALGLTDMVATHVLAQLQCHGVVRITRLGRMAFVDLHSPGLYGEAINHLEAHGKRLGVPTVWSAMSKRVRRPSQASVRRGAEDTGAIEEAVAAAPGITLGKIAARTGLTRDRVRKLLPRLESQRRLRSGPCGRQRLYFPVGLDLSPVAALFLERLNVDTAERLVRALAAQPESTMPELERQARLTSAAVSYHAWRLQESGLVDIHEGRPTWVCVQDPQAARRAVEIFDAAQERSRPAAVPEADGAAASPGAV